MEVAPQQLSPEVGPELDVVAHYGDRVVTMFGVTDTLERLVGMCPLSPDDPRMHTAAKNEFAIKIINIAGEDVEPGHEGLFTSVLDKVGMDRNFNIKVTSAVPDQEQTPVRHVIHKPEPRAVESKTPTTEALEIHRVEHAAQIHEAEMRHHMTELREYPSGAATIAIKEHTDFHADDKGQRATVARFISAERTHTQNEVRLQEMSAERSDNVMPEPSHILTVTDTESVVLTPDVPRQTQTSDREAIVQQATSEVSNEPLEQSDSQYAPQHEVVSGANAENQMIRIVQWEAELIKPPAELYEDFQAALEVFITNRSESGVQDETAGEAGAQAEAPEIAATVAERLAEADDVTREQVAPILRDIAGAIHGLGILEARGASQDYIAATEAQLAELCVSLFEVLGIDYDQADIQQFMQVLGRPDFMPVATARHEALEASEADLEHDGTREAKLHFPLLLRGVVRVEHRLHLAIGRFVLRSTRRALPVAA